jgi:hypothetical protein
MVSIIKGSGFSSGQPKSSSFDQGRERERSPGSCSRELLAAMVAHDKTGFQFIDRPRRREAAGGH